MAVDHGDAEVVREFSGGHAAQRAQVTDDAHSELVEQPGRNRSTELVATAEDRVEDMLASAQAEAEQIRMEAREAAQRMIMEARSQATAIDGVSESSRAFSDMWETSDEHIDADQFFAGLEEREADDVFNA